MKKYVLQALLVLCSFVVIQACSDDDNDIDLAEMKSAAAAMPSKVFFPLGTTEAATFQLSVAVSERTPETIGFEASVADDSEISADKVSFSRERFSIEAGNRSFELNCTVEADAVEPGATKLLKIDFMSQNSKIAHMKLEVPVEAEKEEEPEPEPEPEPENTIVSFTGLDWFVDFTNAENTQWAGLNLGTEDSQFGSLFRTSTAIGSAPAAKRIHIDNYGGDVIGVADGDIINITPLDAEAVIGNGATWVTNPEFDRKVNWMYMPVLYAANYTEWVGKTAYAGMKVWIGDKWCNAWFKVVVTEDLEVTITDFAYDAWGHDIKAGQTVSEKK